ncbi:MAG: hypothetical protein JOZ52_07040 [Acidobacteria bacterium]|nr:hypothetical protein [Acidobacteriota bacterium]
MFVKKLLSLLIMTLFVGPHALLAQTPAPTPEAQTETKPQSKTDKEQEEEAQKKLTAQALELLDAVIKDNERLTLPQNRAYVSINAASLLWKYDEPQARSLFKDASADLRTMMNEPETEEMPRGYRQKMERTQLREKLLFSVARLDARLALVLLEETRPAPSQKKENASPVDAEEEFEARLASIIAQNDPSQAVELARKSLAKGFSYNLPNLLSEIQKKDSEAASQLAVDILAKLKTTTLATNQEAYSVAVMLLRMASDEQAQKSASKDSKPMLSDQSMRELAELIASAVLNASSETAARYMSIGSLMPLLEKYAPSRAQQLRRKNADEAESDEGGDEIEETGAWQQYQKLMESGSTEDWLAAAEKVEPGMRETFYRQAAFRLTNEGKTDRARQLISEHIADPDQRAQMLKELDRQALAASASQGKMDETRKYLSSVATNEERISALAQLASAVALKGDKKIALQLLEEARNLSPSRPKYSRQLVAQLQIARAYAVADPDQSFAILEPSIDRLNDIIAAGIMLGEFFAEEDAVRDDELVIHPFIQMIESFQMQYGRDLNTLARANFTRTRDAAEKFQRYEVRLLARLLLAQSILAPKSESDKPAPYLQNRRYASID